MHRLQEIAAYSNVTTRLRCDVTVQQQPVACPGLMAVLRKRINCPQNAFPNITKTHEKVHKTLSEHSRSDRSNVRTHPSELKR